MKRGKVIFISLLMVLLIFSCKTAREKLIILPIPIFSETDSFLSSTGYLQHNKTDYFLVKTNMRDTLEMANPLDSFVKQNASKQYLHYDNYSMVFYRESTEVNEIALRKYLPGYGYKMFLYNEKDLIIYYDFYVSTLIGRKMH